jgi:acyl transferase domain-containing protein
MSDGIAIIGMACTFPGARNVSRFWENILNKVDAIADVPPDRWDTNVFYDPDPAAEDRIYCKKGGWIGSTFAFNPIKYGIMPSTIDGAEPDHFLVLRTVDEALADAGYANRPMDGRRVSVIVGKGNYLGPGVAGLMYRGIIAEQMLAVVKGLHPELSPADLAAIKTEVRRTLPKLTPEVAAGLIPNICSGRVANRLDFMGRNFTVDAACASSLIATELGVEALTSGRDDLVLVGGVHIFAQIPFLQVFDMMRALSLTSTIRPFDEHADGTICGEGVGMLVLKRLADAERDGDRIYALVRAAASASDGRAKSVTAPRVEGEELALRRAYDSSQVPPGTVGLIEAHGTGTSIGDATEIEALQRVFGAESGTDGGGPTCALGSVKSMIGHAMPAAGAAGMIKAALALSEGVLPPTLNCETPRASLTAPGSRFYVNTETRPWIQGPGSPRRAGVNAFGFGGINAHVLLEEYVGPNTRRERAARTWGSDVVFVDGDTRADLVGAIDRLRTYTEAARGVDLLDIAATVNARRTPSPHRLAVVAASLGDLAAKLDAARRRLADPACTQIKDRDGIYYLADPEIRGGRLALLFPGEGSQSVNMLGELCVHFPEVRRAFDLADGATQEPGRLPSSALVFPPPFRSPEASAAAAERLWGIDRATESVLTADAAIVNLFERLGLQADMIVGHSAGEWIAMAAAGVIDRDEFVATLPALSAIHRRLDADATIPRMRLLAVGAGREAVASVMRDIHTSVEFANDNCPHQVVIVVSPADGETIAAALRQRGIYVEELPYDRGYHTGAFACIREPLRDYFASMTIRPSRIPLFSCATAETYPDDRDRIIDLVSSAFARPLLFRQTIEAMYAAGARTFVEAGPRGNLSAFVDDILRGRPHLTVAVDHVHRTGLLALNHLIGALASAGVQLDLEWIYQRRGGRRLTFEPSRDAVDEAHSPGAVLISTCYPSLQPPKPAMEYGIASANVASGPDGGGGHMGPPLHSGGTNERIAVAGGHTGPPLHSGGTNERIAVAGGYTGPPVHSGVPDEHIGSPSVGADPRVGPTHASADLSILEEHCAIMAQFLSTQEAVMRGYWRRTGATNAAPQPIAPAVDLPRAVHAEPVPADRVEAPQPAAAPPRADIGALLLRIVSERTGYPVEMLGLDLDMEADLGIDSIKRVEIFSALGQSGNGAGRMAAAKMDELAKLKTLRHVLAFIEHADAAAPPDAVPRLAEGTRVRGPMIRTATIVEEVAGESVDLRCVIDAEDHRYLRDHSLYYPVGDEAASGSRLVAMPMTATLEIMAEAASLLRPDQKVVGARGLQALRWINFEAPSFRTALSISARLKAPGRVRVEVRAAAAGAAEGDAPEIVAVATILLADRYPDRPASHPAALTNPRPPVCTAPEMYSSHRLFHGPALQGVTALSAVAEDGVHGTLTMLPKDGVLASDPAPVFHIDPFLFDAAGQLVGYWPSEYQTKGYVVLPVGVAEVTLYGELLPVASAVDCRVRITDVSPRQIRGDIDLVGEDGRLLMRVARWEDWRFYWPDRIFDFWRFPDREANGIKVDLPDHPEVECRRIDAMGEIDNNGLWEVLWMQMILNARELDACRRVVDRDARRRWLLRRSVAKDAVRMWLRRHAGLEVCAPDIDVSDLPGDGNGSIQIAGRWTAAVAHVPHVAVAIAGDSGFGAASAAPLSLAADAGGVRVQASDGTTSLAPA